MRRSVIRVLLAVVVVTAGGIVWTDLVAAAGREINATLDAAKCDSKWGPPCFTPSNGTVTQITQGETVTWRALDGTHTVTPVDPSAFTGSGDLGPDATFSVTFDKVGVFSFYCRHHGSVEADGKTHHGMWGKIDVRAADDTTSTTAAPARPPDTKPPATKPEPGPKPAPGPTPPPSPPPTSSGGSTGSQGGSSQGGSSHSGSGQTAAGTGRPWVGPPPTQAAPPPPRTAAAGPPATDPPSKPKEKERGTSDTTVPPEGMVVPPDEAVLPPSPQFPTATTAPLAQHPGEVPHGDTIAVLKNEPGGRKRKLVMLGTLFGVGAFFAGVGGWKYMNRSSKYWPA